MRGWRPTVVGLFALLGIGCLVYAADPGGNREKQPPVKVNAEDLCNGKCVIIGRLGRPYGETVKVRAVWKGRSNDGMWEVLHVTHINGREVAKGNPITFVGKDVSQIVTMRGGRMPTTGSDESSVPTIRTVGQSSYQPAPPMEGTVYEGRVYESGGYPDDERPTAVRKILDLPITRHSTYGFRSRLYLIDENDI